MKRNSSIYLMYIFQNLSENINNKCIDKTKLKHSTTYRNGSIQRFSFTNKQNIYWKVSPEWNRFFNWHFQRTDITEQTSIATEYLHYINKSKNNHQNNTKNTKNIIKLPWVPIIGLKLRKEFKKKDIKTVFRSGANLKSILYQNKSKLQPNSYPGVYALNCSCNAEHISETKKKSDDQNNWAPTKQHKGKMRKFKYDGTFV